MITTEMLVAAIGCKRVRAELFADPLTVACALVQVDATPERLAHFLGQIGHESGRLRHTRELWGPTAAQLRYEGREDLGNTQPGDGHRYLGRGLLQVTGRANYRAVTRRLWRVAASPEGYRAGITSAPDFERNPVDLEGPRWASLSAAAWWADHGCNELADAGNVAELTSRINGGQNGLADRERITKTALAAVANLQPVEALIA